METWKKAKLRRILRDFAVWNSASGIPHIARARNIGMRLFWIVVSVGCFFAFIGQMALLVNTYLKYSVIVQTSLKSELLRFPAVTLCNLNPYKHSKVQEFPEVKTLLTDYAKALNGTLSRSEDKWNLTSSKGKIALQLKTRRLLSYIMAAFNASELRHVTCELHELVDSCSFNAVPCINWTASFTEVFDPAYGRCFSFNNDLPVPEHYLSKRAGMVYGLRLILAVDLLDYLPVTISSGVRLAVHGQKENVYPEAFGFDAATGFTTTCALKYIRTERLPYPYGNCVEKSATEYSVEGCLRTCQQRIVVEHCNCSDPTFPLADGSSFCDQTRIPCINEALVSDWYDASVNCSCPPLCNEGAYTTTISTALWPSKSYLLPQCQNHARFETDPAACHDWYRDNTLALAIFFEHISFVLLSESEAYAIVSLMSDFGGQVGLWLGASAITVVEILFLPYLVITTCCCCKPPMDPDQQNEANEFDSIDYGVGSIFSRGRGRMREMNEKPQLK